MKKLLLAFVAVFLLGASPAVAAPPNDMQASPSSIEIGTITGSNLGATRENYEVDHSGVRAKHSIWFSWTASRSGFVTISTEGSSFDTILAVYIPVEGGWLGDIASNDNTVGTASWVRWNAQAGQTYLVALDGRSEGNYQIDFAMEEPPAPPPPRDNTFSCQYSSWGAVPYDNWNQRAVLDPGGFDLQIPAARSTRENGDPRYGTGRTLWFSWIAPSSGRLVLRAQRVHVENTRLDPVLAGYEVRAGERHLLQWNDDWNIESSEAALVLDVRQGQEYAFVLDSVENFNNSCARLSSQLLASNETPALPAPLPVWYAAPKGKIEVSTRHNEVRLYFRETEYSSYSCSLDQADWQPCQSGQVLADVSLGDHTVRLRETRFGVHGYKESAWQFVPRSVQILSGPGRTKKKSATFYIRSFEGALCRLRGKEWRPCSGRVVFKGLRSGKNSLIVKQTVAGHTSKDVWSWKIL